MPEYVRWENLTVDGQIVEKFYSVDPSVVSGLENILKIDRATFNALTKYHKVSGGEVVEMTQEEKDTLDAAEAAASLAAAKTYAKSIIDETTGEGRLWKAVLKTIMGEINILRGQHSLADRTMAQLKQAVKDTVDDESAE